MLGMLALPCFSSTPSMEELRRASGGLCFFESSGIARWRTTLFRRKFSAAARLREDRDRPRDASEESDEISLRKKSCARL